MAQTDTTVGFLSANEEELMSCKKRHKPTIKVVSSFAKLKNLTRVPNQFKNLVRRSVKTTFIYNKSQAIRVVNGCLHSELIDRYEYLYSTSANESGKSYDEQFALNVADVVITTKDGFFEGKPSKILLLHKHKLKKLRV